MKKEEIEAYRKKQIKDVQLPSGLNVKVKNISPYIILKVQEELGIEVGELNKISASLMRKLFMEFLISPKVPSELEVEDFSKEDFEELQNMIFGQIIYAEDEKQSE